MIEERKSKTIRRLNIKIETKEEIANQATLRATLQDKEGKKQKVSKFC